MRVWFLTNGYGEDRAAALVATELMARRRTAEVIAAPLVTPGAAFATRAVPVVTRGVVPPSGGFSTTTLLNAARDLPAIVACAAYVRRLRRLAARDDVFVAAGDTFLLSLARLAFGRPGVHIALAKSVHGRRHASAECLLLRLWASLVFARDEASAVHLVKRRVRAEFVGNPLIDRPPLGPRPSEPVRAGLAREGSARTSGSEGQTSSEGPIRDAGCRRTEGRGDSVRRELARLRLPGKWRATSRPRRGADASATARKRIEGRTRGVPRTRRPTILLLPGSRAEAPSNLVKLLDVATRVETPVDWLCARSPSVPLDDLLKFVGRAAWHRDATGLRGGGSSVLLVDSFDDALRGADIVVGLAGTANEQAAAAGKAVVTFVGAGPQTSAARMEEQERLLGGAAEFVRGDVGAVAAVVSWLIANPSERGRRGAAGERRLGPFGGAARIAVRLIDEFGL